MDIENVYTETKMLYLHVQSISLERADTEVPYCEKQGVKEFGNLVSFE